MRDEDTFGLPDHVPAAHRDRQALHLLLGLPDPLFVRACQLPVRVWRWPDLRANIARGVRVLWTLHEGHCRLWEAYPNDLQALVPAPPHTAEQRPALMGTHTCRPPEAQFMNVPQADPL